MKFFSVMMPLNMPDVDYGYFGSQVAINPPGGYEGPALASAAAIQITRPVHKITGAVAISTINPPYPGFVGHISLVNVGGAALATGGNIATALTGAANQLVRLYYDGSLWYHA